MYIIAGKFSCRPDMVNELTALAEELTALSRQEEGCISYNFYADKTAAGDFLFFEEWRSRQDIDAHFQKPYLLAAMENFPSLIIGPPKIKIYKVESMEEI